MFIKTIKWVDKEAQEAEIIVSDGSIDILCFSCPFIRIINDILVDPIYCLDVQNVVISNEETNYVKKSNTYFGYLICGKLTDKKNKIVYLNDIKLSLEEAYIPPDIPENGFIEFNISRLNLY